MNRTMHRRLFALDHNFPELSLFGILAELTDERARVARLLSEFEHAQRRL